MASALIVGGGDAVVPFVTRVNTDDISYADLVYIRDDEKRKARVPITDKAEPELLLRTIMEFEDACSPSRLHITAGPDKFAKFRECLGEDVRTDWDNCAEEFARTIAGFKSTVDKLVGIYFPVSALEDQKVYLQHAKKPTHYSVRQTASRLRQINRLMRYFPGSEGALPLTGRDLKYALLKIMPQSYNLAYFRTGRDYRKEEETWEDMIKFFEDLEALAKVQKLASSTKDNNGKRKFQGNQKKGFNNNKKKKNQGKDDKKIDGPSNPNAPCPYHNGSHTWRKCFGNPNGDSYKPNFVLKPPNESNFTAKKAGNDKKKQEKKVKAESHHIEAFDEDW